MVYIRFFRFFFISMFFPVLTFAQYYEQGLFETFHDDLLSDSMVHEKIFYQDSLLIFPTTMYYKETSMDLDGHYKVNIAGTFPYKYSFLNLATGWCQDYYYLSDTARVQASYYVPKDSMNYVVNFIIPNPNLNNKT